MMIFWYLPLSERDLERGIRSPERLEEFFFDPALDGRRNIDKSWPILHSALVTGMTDDELPLQFILFGGKVIKSEFPVFRYFNTQEVHGIANSLGAISKQDFLI